MLDKVKWYCPNGCETWGLLEVLDISRQLSNVFSLLLKTHSAWCDDQPQDIEKDNEKDNDKEKDETNTNTKQFLKVRQCILFFLLKIHSTWFDDQPQDIEKKNPLLMMWLPTTDNEKDIGKDKDNKKDNDTDKTILDSPSTYFISYWRFTPRDVMTNHRKRKDKGKDNKKRVLSLSYWKSTPHGD